MTEIDESFSGFDGAAKSYVQKLIPISDLFSLKKTESMGYDVLWSYEQLISSETISWSLEEYVDKLVAKQ